MFDVERRAGMAWRYAEAPGDEIVGRSRLCTGESLCQNRVDTQAWKDVVMGSKSPRLAFQKKVSDRRKVALTASGESNYSQRAQCRIRAIMGENPLHCAYVLHGCIANAYCAGCSPWTIG
jgi:hypothetical protein